MELIGMLRNRMGKILVGVIMLAMLSFIGTDLIGNASWLGDNRISYLAEIDGEEISNEFFQLKMNQLNYFFTLASEREPDAEESKHIREQAWFMLIYEQVYQAQFETLGLKVTDKELVDMVQGNNVHVIVQQFFINPETGQFSKELVINFLANIDKVEPVQQATWILFERSLPLIRVVEKYKQLLEQTNYITKYEAKESYEGERTNLSFEYLFAPFSSIPDDSVAVTDKELEKYLANHEAEYQREAYRSMDYVVIDIIPSENDSALLKEEVNDYYNELVAAQDDSLFVSIYSDDPLAYIPFYDLEDLPDSLLNKDTGYVSQPVLVADAYEFYKFSAIKPYVEDSVVYEDSLVYWVAKMKKEIFRSDETVNTYYQKADSFALLATDFENFKATAKDNAFRINSAAHVSDDDLRVGEIENARNLVLWLYNDAKLNQVSNILETDNKFVVAVMTLEQKKGLANLEDVRNEVTLKVRNEKKIQRIMDKLCDPDQDDLNLLASKYGPTAKTGLADLPYSSNNVTGVGYAPDAIGISKVLDEGETTQCFPIQSGVMMIQLIKKNVPEEIDDYTPYLYRIQGQRRTPPTSILDFPTTLYPISVDRNVDETFKTFAKIQDRRYKFF